MDLDLTLSVSCAFSFRLSNSLLLKMFIIAPESAIIWTGMSIMLTLEIGLAIWGPRLPMLRYTLHCCHYDH